ncbi:hypothetical protein BCR44DRAFT_112762, partial [Catenaria anguillulae PL171]
RSVRAATWAGPSARRLASTEIPKIDPSTIPASRFDNDPADPQFYGVVKESGFDPLVGDYPKLKWDGAQQRNVYNGYWDPVEKRNFGDVLHHEDELLGPMAPDVHTYPTGKALVQLASFFAIMFGVWQAADFVTTHHRPNPAASREYSYPDYAGNKELAD